MATNFLLFDIDSVLIDPRGYRKAVYDTTRYFLDTLGLTNISINEDVITTFESIGITSEWDMIPLYLLSVIEQVLSKFDLQPEIGNSQNSFRFTQPKNYFLRQEELIDQILSYKEFLQEGYSVIESILLLNFRQNSVEIFRDVRTKVPWLINNWFAESRNIQQSEILQYFQNLALGSDLFHDITGLDPFLESEPYLMRHDLPLIKPENVDKIRSFAAKSNVFQAVITARPSAFPAGVPLKKSQLNFPEAELALKCLELDQIKCIGFGALEYLGELNNQSGDQFVKPSPIHAMTALLVSSGVEVTDALNFSYKYIKQKQHVEVVNHFSRFESPINLCIFEDSTIGIQSLARVCESLRSDGLEIKLLAYGISTNQNKIDALKKENAIIFPTINEAFSACVDFLKI